MKHKAFRLTARQVKWLEEEASRRSASESAVVRSLFPVDNSTTTYSDLQEKVDELEERMADVEKKFDALM